MTNKTIRLGALVNINNPNHSLHQQEGRYMGPAELPGMDDSHRICFDGKVQLIQRKDFHLLNPESDLREL